MNRLKFWLYMGLLLLAGLANLYFLSGWLTHRAIAQVDRELTRAVGQVDARSQILAAEAAHLADAVAKDPAVRQALTSEKEGALLAVARTAAQSAWGTRGDVSRPLLVATVGHAGARSFALDGAPIEPNPRIETIVSGAVAEATRQEGYVIVGDGLYYLVAIPTGRGMSVAVGVPIDASWLAHLRTATGCDLTLLLDQRAPQGTLPVKETALVTDAARRATGPIGAGTLPSQPLALGPFPAPAMPLVFASAPAFRVHTVALRGLPGGQLALSQPLAPLLAPVVSYVWLTLIALVALLLVGLAMGLLVTNEQKTMVPKDLMTAADRIARGDFTARAPAVAGSLGSLASALNRAVEAAQGAGARPPPRAEVRPEEAGERVAAMAPAAAGAPASVPDFLGTRAEVGPAHGSVSAQPAGLSDAEAQFEASFTARLEERLAAAAQGSEAAAPAPEAQPAAPLAPELEPANGAPLQTQEPSRSGFDLPGEVARDRAEAAPAPDSFAPAAPPEPAPPAPEPEPEPATAPRDGAPEQPAAQDEAQPAEPAPADEGDGDEDHWRLTYDEFLKVREQCGEPVQGVPYDRFRQKLQKNRDQLVAKYGCRTVRFQVYVKEGRAALKASPVR